MAVEFRTDTIEIKRSNKRRQQFDGSVTFQGKVRVANVALRGFVLDYANNDHHIDVVEVTTNFAGIEGEIVHFRVNCQYADKNFDDEYSGRVEVLVMADLQPA